MNAQRWLQIDLAALTILGTALLSAGQQNMSMAALMLVAAPVAVVFTDFLQWFRLNRPLANLAAVGSVGYAVFQFFTSSVDNQLLSVANLLVYLQLILLLQEKSHRLNWQLLVLSLLEVVVSAAMSLNFRFFILLIIYLFCALAALALLYLLRETSRFEAAPRDRRRGGKSSESASSMPELRDPLVRGLLGGAPRVLAMRKPAEIEADLIRLGYARQVLLFGLLTMVFAAVLFYTTPRLGSSGWQGGRGHRQATVGFSRQISLDEMGDILQSDELALRISFFNEDTDEPVRVVGEPYLRGAVLTRYSDTQGPGRWTIARQMTRAQPLRMAESTEGLVRQEAWLEPTSDALVFGAFPMVRLPGTDPPLRYDRGAGIVSREMPLLSAPAGRFRYVVGSYGFRDNWQTAVVPFEPPSPPVIASGLEPARRQQEELEWKRSVAAAKRSELSECLSFNQYQFPKIKELAEQILNDADASRADPLRKARVLEQHFLQPGNYDYSLRFRQARNREMDPIEDFVANHRTGHCEYFATALTLMLRSQKIPARLVVGYHGGEYNELGNYYLVRQRDAHAWVEAWLDPDQVATVGRTSLPPGGAPLGGWLRLDPTPGGSRARNEASGMVWNRFDDLMEYAEFLWSDYVTGLTPDRQRQSLYAPFSKQLSELFSGLSDDSWRETAQQKLAALFRWLGVVDEDGEFGWQTLVGVAIVVVAAVLLARPLLLIVLWPLGWCLRLARRWAGRLVGIARRSRAGRVEFYDRYERLLARRGCRRRPEQTPWEFLEQALRKSDWAAPVAAWGPAARLVVDSYYRVRYGGAALDKAESEAVEQALKHVAAGLEGRLNLAATPS